MGRAYAGILATVAFATVIARSLMASSSTVSTMKMACLCLAIFGTIGWIIGAIAQMSVEDSVRARIDVEVHALEEASKKGS